MSASFMNGGKGVCRIKETSVRFHTVLKNSKISPQLPYTWQPTLRNSLFPLEGKGECWLTLRNGSFPRR